MDRSMIGVDVGDVELKAGIFRDRSNLNCEYLKSLRVDNLLQNHFFEAGLGDGCIDSTMDPAIELHGGWETPSCQVRGHFLGHWISAAARLVAGTGDRELGVRVDQVVEGLDDCQNRNGGGWVFSIPEKYLDWVAAGHRVAVPHYVIHKTLMGLVDAYKYTANAKALSILERASEWFHRWSSQFSREQMDDILDLETGGMLEVWSDLYGITGESRHRDLLERYTRARLFDGLLASKDVLTNMHANTTIPEIHGAARAFEVTGEDRWREIVEKYWESAVEKRGTFCTGGQTSGEVWTPLQEFAARRGDKNQEHCTVYNMIRLADYLFRWTGEARFSDYIERNIYNGILAQQNPLTGMVSYFLPFQAGGRKKWGTRTNDFWCCHGTLVQAQSAYSELIYYRQKETFVISQFIPSTLRSLVGKAKVTLEMGLDTQSTGAASDGSSAAGARHRPKCTIVEVGVSSDTDAAIEVMLRVPWWVADQPKAELNGKPVSIDSSAPGFVTMKGVRDGDSIRLELPKQLGTLAIPDEPDTVAFHDGPVVLAGLCDREVMLQGDKNAPETILVPNNERKHSRWLTGYRTKGQSVGTEFKPLYEIVDEPYTVYFPVRR